MTIDEEIKHFDEMAKYYESILKRKDITNEVFINYCQKSASERRDVTEWLKRLVIISNAKVEIIRRIEDAKSKDKLCEYPYIRCIDIVKEVFGDDS